MNFKCIQVGYLQVNCYVCYDENEAVIIDPGFASKEEFCAIKDFINKSNLKLLYIINTHGHADHICGNNFVKDVFSNAEICIHERDAEMLTDTFLNLSSSFGVDVTSYPADIILNENSELRFGDTVLNIIETPGHTLGSVCLLSEKDKIMFTGDTLFCGGIGRTDLPNASTSAMELSLKKLQKFDPLIEIYPGHGVPSRIGEEF